MALTLITLHGPWTAEDETFAGEVTIEKPSAELVKLAGAAHAAGAIDVTEGLDLSQVETEEETAAALERAMGDHVVQDLPDGTRISFWTGPWQEGNCLDYIATRSQLVARDDDPDDEFTLEPDFRAQLVTNLAATQRQLDHWQKTCGPADEETN